MRFLSTRTHGVVDYLVGAVLILAPFIFGFANGEAAMWVPIVLGAVLIGYSLFTDYEAGFVRSIEMRTHLGMDAIGGAVLAVSPWLFGFNELVWVPHLLVGLFEIGGAMVTETEPSPTTPADASTTKPA